MLVETRPSPLEEADRFVGVSWLRGTEAEMLLRAVTALRLDGLLSEAEYVTKRRRLLSQL